MSEKPTILHIIESFGRGGAETMLVAVLKQLKEYRNIVVTLQEDNHFTEAIPADEHICLRQKSTVHTLQSVIRLKKIIRENKVQLVHSHLYWPTFIARLATPRRIPLITTIHTSIAYTKDYQKWYIRALDRWSYKYRKSTIIAVAETAMQQYFAMLNKQPVQAHVLYTFVDTAVFKEERNPVHSNGCRVITIGTLRYPKNHAFLLEAFALLKEENISLDIYGSGPMEEELRQQAAKTGAKVRLMGQVADLQHVIAGYDLYVMASHFEGFSLSVLEAMAIKMPLLLSDIPSFREQCADVAMYFGLADVNDLAAKIKLLSTDKSRLAEMGRAAKERLVANFTLEHHMKGLRAIYSEALQQN